VVLREPGHSDAQRPPGTAQSPQRAERGISLILIVTPFRNEEASIRLYLDGLHDLTYPRDRVKCVWIENDSTDATYELLRRALIEGESPYWTKLYRTSIIGPQPKRPPGEYYKDVPYGDLRVKPWIVLWNEWFIPLALKSEANYMVLYMADCVPPPTVFEEYLQVFRDHPEAGWVGGAMHSRYPQHNRLYSPWLLGRDPPSLGSPPFDLPREVCEVNMASPHCAMIPVEALRDRVAASTSFTWDIHSSVINCLKAKGYKVFYTPKVYLQHVSSDGKIYRTGI